MILSEEVKERRLLIAILEDALRAYQRYALAVCNGSASFDEEREFYKLGQWFRSQDLREPTSFEPRCDILGINPDYVRRMIKEWLRLVSTRMAQSRSGREITKQRAVLDHKRRKVQQPRIRKSSAARGSVH